MAKSIRSKSKRKFRAIKRAEIFDPVYNKRLQRCAARLHKDSKVVHVEEPEPESPKYSFSFKNALIDAPARARREAEKAAAMDMEEEEEAVQNTTFGHDADASMDVDQKLSAKSKSIKKKSSGKYNKFTGAIIVKKSKDGKKKSVLKW
ncbi:hypothetical protein BCR44DRAFT_1424805 [Catenaria anguillulae PL171]|uniref:DUF2423 domain-containing protein n=1 Tax=Catenaria anguillulae PL171 TaxID=765915 RepID=A0A1Y2I0C9_9FUNG|nr:hypothetical protein BCR44DRAFT_1424805 [Catenaria anguillulae PL171]